MIGQTRGHCWRPLLPSSFAVTLTQGSHRPAEVIAVHREIGHRLMHVPILGEAVGLPHLSSIAVPVSPVVPIHERCVDRSACLRQCPHGPHTPQNPPTAHHSIPSLSPLLFTPAVPYFLRPPAPGPATSRRAGSPIPSAPELFPLRLLNAEHLARRIILPCRSAPDSALPSPSSCTFLCLPRPHSRPPGTRPRNRCPGSPPHGPPCPPPGRRHLSLVAFSYSSPPPPLSFDLPHLSVKGDKPCLRPRRLCRTTAKSAIRPPSLRQPDRLPNLRPPQNRPYWRNHLLM